MLVFVLLEKYNFYGRSCLRFSMFHYSNPLGPLTTVHKRQRDWKNYFWRVPELMSGLTRVVFLASFYEIYGVEGSRMARQYIITKRVGSLAEDRRPQTQLSLLCPCHNRRYNPSRQGAWYFVQHGFLRNRLTYLGRCLLKSVNVFASIDYVNLNDKKKLNTNLCPFQKPQNQVVLCKPPL